MAFTTLAQVKAALRPPTRFQKFGAVNSANYGAGFSSYWDRIGVPHAGSVNANANYSAPSGDGPLPFRNPPGGQDAYLAYMQMQGTQAANTAGDIMLCDRLWASGALSASVLTAQAITSGPFPARDENGSTDGVGVYLLAEVTTTNIAGGSADTFITVNYTNSAGITNRTGTSQYASVARNLPGSYFIGLQDGDVGVRSVQSFQMVGTTANSAGVYSLVALRPIAALTTMLGMMSTMDPSSGCFAKVHPDSVLFFIGETGFSNSGYPGNPGGNLQFAWG